MSDKKTVPVGDAPDVMEEGEQRGFRTWFNIPSRFAILNKLIRNDLNNARLKVDPRFYLYTRDDIVKFVANPYKYSNDIRNAITYIYGASSHFARIIQYFTGLTYLRYIVSPYKVDLSKVNQKTLKNNFHKIINLLQSANLETELRKIIKYCFKYDTFYGTIWQTADSLSIQQLPDEYCAITEMEGNVFNVTFNFSYFDRYPDKLAYYPEEFRIKYNMYKEDKKKRYKWIVLDPPRSFAVKFNDDIIDYALPPFAGLLREIYDLEDFKNLKLTKTELDNYALLVMKLLMDDEGRWLIDEKKAEAFFSNLSSVLPEQVGAVLSPMPVDKLDFDKAAASDDSDTVAQAEENVFTAAGVSSLIFNNAKASANALLISIKADQMLTFGLVKSIENVLNRYIQWLPYGKNLKIEFLDISTYNEKEAADMYLKGCQYGAPMISRYCAALGIDQGEMESMNYLENELFDFPTKFKPLINSAQVSQNDGTGNPVGRPRKDNTELTDSGEQSREDGVEDGDW